MTYKELLELTKAGVEIWKPIPEFETEYEVSNLGNVKSLDRIVIRGNSTIQIKGRIKKSYIDNSGYRIIMLCKNGKAKTFGLHRIIAKTFIPNPDSKPEVDHINTNRADCSLENLRWVTHKENNNNEKSLQNRRNSTYTPETIRKGMETRKALKSKNGARTVFQYTKDGIFVNEYYSMEEAKRKSGAGHICEVLDDNTQTSGGFLWTSSPSNNLKYRPTKMNNVRMVQQYDLSNNLIREWPSVKEAAKGTGINIKAIYRNIKAANPTKYKFKYKEGV